MATRKRRQKNFTKQNLQAVVNPRGSIYTNQEYVILFDMANYVMSLSLRLSHERIVHTILLETSCFFSCNCIGLKVV